MKSSNTYSTFRIVVNSVREDVMEHETSSPHEIYDYWKNVIATQPDHEPEKESVVVVMLNTRMKAFAWHRVSLGTVSESSCHPREVFRPVIASGSHTFVLMHNHPSGDPSPSRADEVVTRTIYEAGKLLQIHLSDHVIIGERSPGRMPCFSFREAGLIY